MQLPDFNLQFERLIGSHVRLEPISRAHTPGLFEIGQEREDWKYLSVPGFHQMRDAEDWVGQALDLARRAEQYTYVMVDPVQQTVMGSSRYLNIRPPHRGLEIGYTWLGKPFQRTAVNTETKLLMLKHAFETIGVIRVELKTDSRNLRSQMAIERLGATREGLLRSHMLTQNNFVRDSVLYSIIIEEWPKIKSQLTEMLRSPL